MENSFRQGFDRVSSAPRLSFSSQDVFNLRNHHLSQLSRSSGGIYRNENHSMDFLQHKVIYNSTSSVPKSILVKPKQESLTEINSEEEKEEQKSYYSLRLELQFSAFVLFFFVLVILIPISMIVMGSIHLSNCPVQVMIPIFLIVGGASFLFSILLLRKLNKLAQQNDEDRICFRKTFTIAVMFQLGWFITGCYWIYGSYEPDYYTEESTQYCHKTLYLYSFWMLNAIFLSLSFFAILFTIYICFRRDQTATEFGTKV